MADASRCANLKKGLRQRQMRSCWQRLSLKLLSTLELGAGVGAASLALAARLEQVKVTAVERDEEIAALLVQNIDDNQMSARMVGFAGDAFDAKPFWEGRHDLVMMNPPYNDHRSTLSGDEYRKTAMATDDLGRWIKAGAKGLALKGRL